jgi:hypothetical protein
VISRAKFTNAAVKKPKAMVKKTATPYSALIKAMTISADVTMALIVEKRIALFKSNARFLSWGISDSSKPLILSSSAIALSACQRSMMRFMRAR